MLAGLIFNWITQFKEANEKFGEQIDFGHKGTN